MTKKGIIAAVVVVILVIAAVAGCVVAFNNNSDCTITYEPNYDGSPTGEKVTYKSGTEIADPLYLHRANYTHDGWYFDKECTKPVAFPYKVDKNVTMYAKWTTDAAAKYFDENFYFDNDYGRALAKWIAETTGAQKIDTGNLKNMSAVSHGNMHFVAYDKSKANAQFVVVNLAEKKTAFTIPAEGVKSVHSVGNDVSNYEFVITQNNGQYYIYDMNGHRYGPAESEPMVLFHDMIVFSGKCYGFDDKGNIVQKFEIKSNHIPAARGVNSYCELYGEVGSDGVFHYKYVNVLDSKFNLIGKMLTIPENAVNCVCYHIGGDKYFVQYAQKVQSDYDYMEDGARYKLSSCMIDVNNKTVKIINIGYPVTGELDMWTKYPFVRSLANDVKNVIVFRSVGENKEVTDRLVYISFNADGKVDKKISDAFNKYSISNVFPLMQKGMYVVTYANTAMGAVTKSIVDGSGEKFVAVLEDLDANECVKYFIKFAKDESTRTDFNIYDANGKVVGDFKGKQYANCTNNDMFFTDSAGKMYVFSDGKMNELQGYGGELLCYKSCYCYKNASNKYTLSAENGTVISNGLTGVYCREYLMPNGDNFVAAYVDGNISIFKLINN